MWLIEAEAKRITMMYLYIEINRVRELSKYAHVYLFFHLSSHIYTGTAE